jgi:LuxR family maltose regulon positive regulatory protein
LLARLDVECPLTVLRAPLGFGKTTLLAQWLSGRDRQAERVAWLRVREGARTGSGFWRDLVRVLVDAGLHGLRPAPASAAELAVEIESAIARSERPLILVVDGFERLVRGIDRTLLEIVRHSAGLHLIVAGRSHRRFPDHALGDVDTSVLRARDLLFTAEETAQLVAEVGLGTLPERCAKAIYDSTGGWPEPARAFALALQGRQVDADQIAATARRIGTDYLRRRLLPATTRSDRVEFALAMSVPDEVTAELAETLTGERNAKSLLEWLHGEGLLIAEQRDGETVYTWPTAARAALAAELHRRDPAREAQLHARLARWHLAGGRADPALRHALTSRDWTLAVEVIDAGWRSLLFAHPETLFQAFTEIPLEAVATSPRVLALRDYRVRVPDKLLKDLTALPDSHHELGELGASEHAVPVLETGLIVIGALRRRGLFGQARVYCERLREVITVARSTRLSEVAAEYPAVEMNLGISRLLSGDISGCIQPLQVAHEFASDNPLPYIEPDAASKLALAHAVLGEPDQAQLWLGRYADAPRTHTWLDAMSEATAAASRLLIALDHLDGRGTVAAHRALPASQRIEEFWAFILYARGQYALSIGAVATMLDQISAARAAYRDWLGHGAVAGPLLTATEANLLLAAGRGNAARAAISGRHVGHALLHVPAARLALLSGDTRTALRLARDRAWDRGVTHRDHAELLLIEAVAARRLGDEVAAVSAFGRAVDTMRGLGMLRPLLTVPREELAALAGHLPRARELLDRRELEATQQLYPSSIMLVRLTDREQLVLDQLAQGRSSRQIAETLVVSINTVRTQLRSLYRKLDVESRHDALDRARHYGLAQ